MSLFSFLRKNKQEPVSDDSVFRSRAEGEPGAVRTRSRRQKSERGEQGDAPVDPVLPEKKRARRRLIGAVALVLAAIIGLPMILDSEPQPLAEDIAIHIPSKDKPSQPGQAQPPAEREASRVPAASSLDPAEEVVEPTPMAKDNAKPASQAGAAPQGTSAPGEAAEAAKAPETAKAATADKPVDKPAGKAPAAKPEPRNAEKSDDSARAMALLEGKGDPKGAAAKPTRFVIQVAALASQDKVSELQSRLNNAGIRSFTQKISTASGDRIRIRVGPFASKEEADRIRAKIVKLGLNGTLVPA